MIPRVARRRGQAGGDRDGGPIAGQRGSVAAELAVALPAVVVVVVLGIGALTAAATHVRLQDVTADAARLLARGEPEGRAAGTVAQAVPGAVAATSRRGDLVCVTAAADARIAGIAVPLRAASCALDGGL